MGLAKISAQAYSKMHLKTIIRRYTKDTSKVDKINPLTSVRKMDREGTLGMDMRRTLEFLADLNRTLKIEVSFSDLEKVRTFGGLDELIKSKLKGK